MIKSFLLNKPDKDTDLEPKFRVITKVESPNCKIEVLEQTTLEGFQDIEVAASMILAQQQGLHPKFIRITLNGGGITLESGLLYMRSGNIQSRSSLSGPGKSTGLGGIIGNAVRSSLTQESLIKPEYWGTGELWIEPTFAHYILMDINPMWGNIVCDKGMFCACEPGIKVSAETNFNTGGVGGDGLFQTKLSGTGYIILKSPVPASEILVYQMQNDTLQIDGNFALLRAGNITYSLKKSMNSLAGSLISGEGFLQTFQGTGMVYVAPTSKIYQTVMTGSTQIPTSSNTKVQVTYD